jgi:transglutaminase-like putative cysteine protease
VAHYDVKLGDEREIALGDGSAAVVTLTVRHEWLEVFGTRRNWWGIDPALAEVWPAVWRARGHVCYADEPLHGTALAAWLARYEEDLIALAQDEIEAQAERQAEARADRY